MLNRNHVLIPQHASSGGLSNFGYGTLQTDQSISKETQKSTLVDDRLTKSSDTVKPTNINSRNSFIIKPIYSTNSMKSANSNILKLGSNNLGRSCQAGPGNSTAQSLQSGNKSGSKKKKSVKLTQRLGNMLKKEQHKQHGSSLADFLSSI
ncbi:hypothetical protein MAR_008344 [Mya arenaria]|uniref:Uncharacterized protein n=1 Tax=Mya arenaria TaxID=6604 RepID=A0ABY7DZW1_MYAAR|nr:hypothetical protein MAR_008344 [Mya arenaria]